MFQLPKLSEIFLLSCVIGVGISYGDLYLFHIILGLLILFSFKLLRVNKYKINLNFFTKNYIYFLIIFFLWYFLSIFWSLNKIYTIQYLFYIFCGVAIVLTVLINFSSKEKLLRALKIAGFAFSVEIILSLLESLTKFRLPISPFSNIVTFFGREPSLQPTLDSFSIPSLIQPPTGFQWNPNDLAITMIMLTPFFLFLKNNFVKWFAIIAISIIIIMTSSRTVLFSMGILFLIYFILYKKQITTLILISLLLSVFFTQIDKLKESSNPQVSDIANTFTAIQDLVNGDIIFGQSVSIRQELALNGIKALIKTYGLGVGAGGSIAVQEKIGGVDGRITSMHNFWLELIVDSGVVFSFFFFLWYISLTWNLYKLGIQSNNEEFRYLGRSFSLCMIIFVPAAISASSVIYFLPMWLMLGFAIAIIEIDSKVKSERTASSFLQYFPIKNYEHVHTL